MSNLVKEAEALHNNPNTTTIISLLSKVCQEVDKLNDKIEAKKPKVEDDKTDNKNKGKK